MIYITLATPRQYQGSTFSVAIPIEETPIQVSSNGQLSKTVRVSLWHDLPTFLSYMAGSPAVAANPEATPPVLASPAVPPGGLDIGSIRNASPVLDVSLPSPHLTLAYPLPSAIMSSLYPSNQGLPTPPTSVPADIHEWLGWIISSGGLPDWTGTVNVL